MEGFGSWSNGSHRRDVGGGDVLSSGRRQLTPAPRWTTGLNRNRNTESFTQRHGPRHSTKEGSCSEASFGGRQKGS